MSETEVAISNMLNAIQQGILTRSTKERLDDLEKRKDELEAKIAQEKLDHPKISEEFIRFWLERFRKLDVTKQEHRKMLIDTFVNAVFLYDDRMVIAFNFKEGEDTIKLCDVEENQKTVINGSDMKLGGELPGALKVPGLFCMPADLHKEADLRRYFFKGWLSPLPFWHWRFRQIWQM